MQKQTGHSTCTYEKSADSDPCTNMGEGTPWDACELSVMIIVFSEGIFKLKLSSFRSPFWKRWDILCAYWHYDYTPLHVLDSKHMLNLMIILIYTRRAEFQINTQIFLKG